MLFPRLFALFIFVPVVELVLFMVLGRHIGIPGTLALIIITALLGASLTRSQGLRTLERFQKRVGSGQIPGEEVIAGLLILIAGALLITPGFLTDAVGFSLLMPPVRSILGRWLLGYYATKAQWKNVKTGQPERFPRADEKPGSATSKGSEKVIDVETKESSAPE